MRHIPVISICFKRSLAPQTPLAAEHRPQHLRWQAETHRKHAYAPLVITPNTARPGRHAQVGTAVAVYWRTLRWAAPELPPVCYLRGWLEARFPYSMALNMRIAERKRTHRYFFIHASRTCALSRARLRCSFVFGKIL